MNLENSIAEKKIEKNLSIPLFFILACYLFSPHSRAAWTALPFARCAASPAPPTAAAAHFPGLSPSRARTGPISLSLCAVDRW